MDAVQDFKKIFDYIDFYNPWIHRRFVEDIDSAFGRMKRSSSYARTKNNSVVSQPD